ncbi:MAG: hypothetical protein DRJ03_07360 [Chloroflexi bacterium]|nr:MAG: hypothetical protein DRJ03_07360 [Chloroflexota bacterium]
MFYEENATCTAHIAKVFIADDLKKTLDSIQQLKLELEKDQKLNGLFDARAQLQKSEELVLVLNISEILKKNIIKTFLRYQDISQLYDNEFFGEERDIRPALNRNLLENLEDFSLWISMERDNRLK